MRNTTPHNMNTTIALQFGSTVALPPHQCPLDTDGIIRYRCLEACAELDSVCLFLFAEK